MSDELLRVDDKVSVAKTDQPSTFYAYKEEVERGHYRALLAHLFGFKGRYSRETFWLVYGGCMMAAVVVPFLMAVIFWPLLIALTWVSIAAVIKRYHDRGKCSAWWLVSFIPFVGTFWILVECGFMRGDAGPNEYGAKGLTPGELLR
jgi:uncharacterized membrane protein YhaH (DUF805 family)